MSAPVVRIVEVGPRDGLQNEPGLVPTAEKIAFVEALADAGATDIEVTSFVHPKVVPQLADAADVLGALKARPGVTISALVPNMKGLERAIATGVQRVAVFTAASETFAERNIRMSIEDSLREFAVVVREARAADISVRGYLSTCFVCPYEGVIAPARVRELVERLLEVGVDEVAVSDTIGAAVPKDVEATIGCVLERVRPSSVAMHMHDTYGTALANVCAGLALGITTFDSSAGGLGGCPFAPGASGNLATEDLVYLLEQQGVSTGITLDGVFRASSRIAGVLGRDLPSRQYQRLAAACGGRT